MAKRGIQGAMMRVTNVREHTARVIGKEVITPGFLRIHMHSETLFEDAELAPTAWLRFWFPDHTGKDFEHQRAYTISSGNAESGHFSADFVIHEPVGPASAWAQRCGEGDTIEVTTLGSSKFELPTELPAGYLLIGDAAGIPGLNGLIAALPNDVPVELYLEEHRPEEREIPLAEHPMLRTHRVRRHGPQSLVDAIEVRDWSNWYVWATPESASLKHLRARLKNEFGFPKSEIHAQAYWIEGRAMGKMRGDEPVAATATVVSSAEAASGPDAIETVAREQRKPQRGAWRASAGSRLLAPLKPIFIAAGILQGLVTLIELAPFFLLVELSRRLLAGEGPGGELWTIGIWAVVLMALGALLAATLLLWLHVVDARFERDLRRRLLGKLARLPLGWFGARGSSQVKRVIQDDTLALHYLVTHAVGDAVAAVVAPVLVLVYLFVVDWRLALLMFVPVLVYAVTMYIMVLRSYDSTPKALKWAERMGKEAGAYLEGQPVVRAFGGAAASTFQQRIAEYTSFLSAWQRPFTGLKTFMDLVTRPATFLMLICVFGTLWIVNGSLEAIDLLPFLLLGTTLGARLLGIGYGLSGLRDGLAAARRVQVVLEEEELETRAAEEPVEAKPEEDRRGTVRFEGVRFAYRPGTPVLSDISLTLSPGSVTALVGPSGSGKSTLAALLARFHDVDEGEILIDGADIRTLTVDELYAMVGFVFQDTQLVRGTVRENIALARPELARPELTSSDAGDELVVEAARAANIHERIMQMPHGYDTQLGPDAALSGGERQRITIARAILADTPVLVLDEATAFADPESEFLVQQALSRLTANRTVLVIAHRLHTVTDADRIVVLDDGCIAESGTHEELMAADGRYRKLWSASTAETAAGRGR